MKMQLILLSTMLLFPVISQAQSILVEYELENINNNRYKYTYSVTNDGFVGDEIAANLFSIQFDKELYNEATLSIASSPPISEDWDEKILFSVPGDSVVYDVASTSGIAAGQVIEGFSVEFDWLGEGTPASQSVNLYDSETYELLHSSMTSLLVTIPPGDTNGDGEINVLDIIAAINMVFNGETVTEGADCNSDGNSNVLDIICLINKVFN